MLSGLWPGALYVPAFHYIITTSQHDYSTGCGGGDGCKAAVLDPYLPPIFASADIQYGNQTSEATLNDQCFFLLLSP